MEYFAEFLNGKNYVFEETEEYRESNKNDDNYRGISPSCVGGKVYSAILENRTSAIVESLIEIQSILPMRG